MQKRRVRHHVNPLADQREVSFEGFGNAKPLIVDVGADRGEFTHGLIEKFGTTKNIIVLEIRTPLVVRLEQRFAPYEHVVVHPGDAVRNLRAILSPCIAQGTQEIELYVNFPDPWFKARHHKRRVISQRLLDDVIHWMPPHAVWIFQTDQKTLFEETVALLQENHVTDISYFTEPPYGLTTKWEDAKTARGAEIYRMRFSLPDKGMV